MKSELLKVEFKRGVDALLPYAREHKQSAMTRTRLEAPGPGHRYEFPPYFMIFTIEAYPGADCPIVSVSAPMRPVKSLNASEKEAIREAFAEIFHDHRIMTPRSLIHGSAAFKVIAFPPDSPAELMDMYKSLDTQKT